MTCHGFDKDKPVLFTIINHNIRHFSMRINFYANFLKVPEFVVVHFIPCVTHINNFSSGRKTGTKFLDNFLYQFVLSASREFNFLAIWKIKRLISEKTTKSIPTGKADLCVRPPFGRSF